MASISQSSWIFDERFTCGRKEKAWKSESKKELPVGQAVTELSAWLRILLWRVSAL
uniref:Uncharacterized protein n=1 Tax=Zea mays TaxID=4577 RepID=C0PA95_MAIZE|nr:unknown [Zea mays]